MVMQPAARRAGPAALGAAVFAAMLLTGCPPGPAFQSGRSMRGPDELPPPLPEPEPEPKPKAADPAVMHAYFEAIDAAQRAVVRGDPAGASQQGQRLSMRLRGSSPPGPWVAFVEQIVGKADALARAEALPQAAIGVAELAHACGGCHRALDVEPQMPSLDPPAEHPTPMQWHGWAAARMWEGLVAPSEDRWRRGTSTFHELPGCATPGDATRDPRCAATRDLARQAHLAPDDDARTKMYGHLLTTCARCHLDHKP